MAPVRVAYEMISPGLFFMVRSWVKGEPLLVKRDYNLGNIREQNSIVNNARIYIKKNLNRS